MIEPKCVFRDLVQQSNCDHPWVIEESCEQSACWILISYIFHLTVQCKTSSHIHCKGKNLFFDCFLISLNFNNFCNFFWLICVSPDKIETYVCMRSVYFPINLDYKIAKMGKSDVICNTVYFFERINYIKEEHVFSVNSSSSNIHYRSQTYFKCCKGQDFQTRTSHSEVCRMLREIDCNAF